MMNSVKRYTFLFVALSFIVLSYAQTPESSAQLPDEKTESDSIAIPPIEIYFDSAEVTYAQFFMMKEDLSVNKEELYKVLFEEKKPSEAINDLMTRSLKAE